LTFLACLLVWFFDARDRISRWSTQFSLDLCNKTRNFHFFVGIASNIIGISPPDPVYFDCWILLLVIWCFFKKLLFEPVSQFPTNLFPTSIFSFNFIGLQNLCALQLFFFIGAVCTLHPLFFWRRSIWRGYSVSYAPIVCQHSCSFRFCIRDRVVINWILWSPHSLDDWSRVVDSGFRSWTEDVMRIMLIKTREKYLKAGLIPQSGILTGDLHANI
jgi:hypothetical protein